MVPAEPNRCRLPARFGPHAPGLYQFTATGSEPRLVAVNLKPEESDLTPYSTPKDFLMLASTSAAHPQVAASTLKLSREEAENQQRVWWWLLVAALFFLLAELRLANRTTM